jgi:sigma-B regulation protein RsbU (phosphoserine phosphatase)
VNQNLSIRKKTILITLVINALAIAIFTGIAYWQERDSFLRGVDEKLRLAANSMLHLLPSDYHAGLTSPESVTPEVFQQAQQDLTDYARANGLAFLYSCVEKDGEFYFVASSMSEAEIESGTAATFYELYEQPPPQMREAWQTGTTQVAEYEDPYGSFRSIFVPMQATNVDGSPGTRFIVTSDIYVEFIDDELRNTILLCISIGAGIFILIALISQSVLSRLLAPISTLTRSTHDLVEGNFRLSDDHRADLATMATAQQDEIGQLAHAFEEMVKQLEVYIEDLKTVTAAKERIESEMKIAGDIQQGFVPHAYTPDPEHISVDLHAVLHPAKQVGGDLYDFFHLDSDHLFFAIGDVSDKGAPAALFMAVTLTLLRTLIKHDATPDHLLAATNRSLNERNEGCQFVTMFCGVLNTRTGAVQYAHGGHNPPYVFSPRRGELRDLSPVSGMVLGAFDTSEYQTESLQLARDDILLLYTDGVTEAMNVEHELYGEERLEACLKTIDATAKAEDVTQAVLEDVAAHTLDAPPSDDLTMLCIRLGSTPTTTGA